MRLVFRPGLGDQIGAIINECNTEYAGRGDRLSAALDDVLERLRDFPEMGWLSGYESTRRVLIPRSDYILTYRFFPEDMTLYVISVVHAARHPRVWRGEVDKNDP